MSNGNAFAALDAHIAKMKQLAGMAERAAPAVAKAVETELRTHIDAHETPEGVAWAPKRDGTPALPNAGEALTVEVIGTTIAATITGIYARHNDHKVRGHRSRRSMLPKRGVLTEPLAKAIGAALEDEFKKTMGK